MKSMICIIVLLTLNLSCTQPEGSNGGNVVAEKSNLNLSSNTKGDTLVFTSGIRSILQDRKGNYWFGSHQEGVCLFDGKTFTYFTTDDGLSDNQVRTIQEDRDGVIWFGTGNGVSSYKDGVIKNQTPGSAITGSGFFAKANWDLTENDLWFDAGTKFGAYRYDYQKLSYLELPVQGIKVSNNVFSVTGFSKGKNGNLWIATFAGVIEYVDKSFKIIDDKSLGYSKETGLLHVRSILEDSKGNLWIGNNGIGVLLKKGDAIINFSEQNNLIHSSSSRAGDKSPAGTLEHVFVIKEDDKGNIWFGDRDTGAWKFDGRTMTNYTIGDDLKHQMVWSIYQDHNGDLLFGMETGGVYQFNGKSFDRKY